jgi:hypothetical protein
MTQALSSEEALAEVRGYAGLEPTRPEIQSLYGVTHSAEGRQGDHRASRKEGHRLSDLQHLPDGENWWDKVHEDMLVADDHPYVEEQPGTTRVR